MKRSKLFLTVFFLMTLAFHAEAQKKKTPQKPVKKTTATKQVQKQASQKTVSKEPSTPPSVAEDEKKVRSMITFLEYMLNTLGNSSTSARDKEVLVTQSYSKIFRDAKVQVEDDLDADRTVITNKDVVAYLKDVDFFYQDVTFEFVVENIQQGTTTAGGKNYYKVALRRNMKGTTSEGQLINNSQPRFVEINYDPNDQDLKIVSIYTKQLDEKLALKNWWKDLSYEWQAIFRRKLTLVDSVSLADIKRIMAIEELDLSNNQYLQSLNPITELTKLKTLNLSNTPTSDLSPLRNMTELTELNIANTKVNDLSHLKYASLLTKLDIDHTQVQDISLLEKMSALTYLDASHTYVIDATPLASLTSLTFLSLEATKVSNIAPLVGLTALQQLNLGQSAVQDIAVLSGLKNVTELTLDSTFVSNIQPLSGMNNLKVLYINHTGVADLQPLQKLQHLEKIYCDQTAITRKVADTFIASKPGVLIVFDSKDLQAWWGSLPDAWKRAFEKITGLSGMVSNEGLAKVTTLDSINVSGQTAIHSLEPLRKLRKLIAFVGNGTGISDLSPLQELTALQYLDISETPVTDLSPLSHLTELKVLRADKSKMDNIEPLMSLAKLKRLYVDQTMVQDIIAREFLEKNSTCLIVYKTIHLNRWWSGLSPEWKNVYRAQLGKDTTANRENLHILTERESIAVKDEPVRDLNAFSEFVRLKELHLTGTAINDVGPLVSHAGLKSLHVSNSPLQKIEPLAKLQGLEDLDLSNTPVDDLEALEGLVNIKKLNCAGTQIKRLDPLEKLQNLQSLDCSNTLVSKLEPVEKLPLTSLKCYNTKIPNKRIESFKAARPECNVVYYR